MRKYAWLVWGGIVGIWGCSESATQFASAPVSKIPEQSDLQTGGQGSAPEGLSYAQEDKTPLTPSPSDSSQSQAPLPSVTSDHELSLAVVLPAPELRLGGKSLQAKALLDGVEESSIRWSVVAPAGKVPGLINAQGLYQSPAAGTESYKVQIHAVWLDDESIQASAELLLVPSDQVFVNCTQQSLSFPIVADVYSLPANTKRLPDFNQIASSKATTVCMERFDVATRDWTTGFPGVPNLFEWFALKTHSRLQAPVAGSYRFRLNSDDGAKLYIDKKLIIDNDGLHSPKAVEATVSLSAGSHELVLEYFQGPRTQIALELFWIPANAPSSSPFVYVPRDSFR